MMPFCQVCGGALRQHRPHYVMQCVKCGALRSTLEPEINGARSNRAIDESFRGESLRPLRQSNYQQILARLKANGKNSGMLLDVGCAHGWFLEAAGQHGFDVVGLEPDRSILDNVTHSFKVITGYFPDALDNGQKFDIVTFNDVFEHLRDIRSSLKACVSILKPGGMLVINAPSRLGVFYRAAALLDRIGIRSPIDRLWQKGFPSPHIHYFAPNDIVRLAAEFNLSVTEQFPVTSVNAGGLWKRLRYDSASSFSGAALMWAFLLPLIPLIRAAPADVIVSLLSKPNDGAGSSSDMQLQSKTRS